MEEENYKKYLKEGLKKQDVNVATSGKSVRVLKTIKKGKGDVAMVQTTDKEYPIWLADLKLGFPMGKFKSTKDAENSFQILNDPRGTKSTLSGL